MEPEDRMAFGVLMAFAIIANLVIFGFATAALAVAARWVWTGTLPW